MLIKQRINEFLCKYAQPEYKDKYGNIIRKENGQPYKLGKVTVLDVLINLIIFPLLIILFLFLIISFIGDSIGKFALNIIGISISIWWIINPFINGVLFILGIFVIFFICYIIYSLLIKEVAKCPVVEIPPERKICEKCGAPLPYKYEKIKVGIKPIKVNREDNGKCEICNAPKLYEGEEFTIEYIEIKAKSKCSQGAINNDKKI